MYDRLKLLPIYNINDFVSNLSMINGFDVGDGMSGNYVYVKKTLNESVDHNQCVTDVVYRFTSGKSVRRLVNFLFIVPQIPGK